MRAPKRVLAWALNVASKGTPMLFMGSECHLEGYWHDGLDLNGDHRFDWSIAGDPIGMSMRRLVQAANQTRWDHPALRNGGLEVTQRDPTGVIAFKRWNSDGDVVLIVVNASDTNHTGKSYGVATGRPAVGSRSSARRTPGSAAGTAPVTPSRAVDPSRRPHLHQRAPMVSDDVRPTVTASQPPAQ
jgi:1,4-alpha-glucan branching enzyme